MSDLNLWCHLGLYSRSLVLTKLFVFSPEAPRPTAANADQGASPEKAESLLGRSSTSSAAYWTHWTQSFGEGTRELDHVAHLAAASRPARLYAGPKHYFFGQLLGHRPRALAAPHQLWPPYIWLPVHAMRHMRTLPNSATGPPCADGHCQLGRARTLHTGSTCLSLCSAVAWKLTHADLATYLATIIMVLFDPARLPLLPDALADW